MLMNADAGGVDHIDVSIVTLWYSIKKAAVPDARLTPAAEPIVKFGARTLASAQDAVDHPPVVNPLTSTAVGRQQWCNDCPFFVAQLVTAHENLLLGE